MDIIKNTKVSYQYTDASNYHAYNECVLHGVLSPEQKQEILDCLYEGEFFVPGAVGLDVELPWEYNPQDDHPYWTIDEDSFEETNQHPTTDITVDVFVRAFVENKDRWEQLGVEYTPDFEEDLVAGVDSIIENAEERTNCVSSDGKDDYDCRTSYEHAFGSFC